MIRILAILSALVFGLFPSKTVSENLYDPQLGPQYGPRHKTIFVSVPKSGTHLLIKAIEWIANAPVWWIGLSDMDRFDPAIDLLSLNPIVGIHLCEEADLVRKEYSDRYNKILIIRDPRDAMVSFMHHLSEGKLWCGCPGFDYERFFSLDFDGKLRETLLYPGRCFSPKQSFIYAAEWIKDTSVFVCRFEDLVGERGGASGEKQRETIRNLAERLGVSLDEWQLDEIGTGLFGGTWTFRQGQVGAWKEAFSDENKELFKQLMGQLVIDLGYESDSNW